MPLTLAEAKVSRLNRISGVCSTSADFLQILNDATRQLMRRGNWWGTVIKIRVCVYDGCFALPAYVGTVLATNICGMAQPVSNHWYEFLRVDRSDWCCDRQWQSSVMVEMDGTTPVFRQIPCGGAYKIRAYPRAQGDLGKTVTVFGVDSNGQIVQTVASDGTMVDGEVLTLVLPYAESTTWFRSVTRVIKDVTQSTVDVYMWNPVGSLLVEMAHYLPYETNPNYRHVSIHGTRSCGGSSCCCPSSITILAKLAFVPVINDNDLVLIDNLDALAVAIQSIKQSDAYEHEEAERGMARAVHELNLDLRDKFPNESIAVNVSPYGTASLRRQGIGSLM